MLPIKGFIKARSHAAIKSFREVVGGKRDDVFLLEGVRFLEEAVKAKFPVETVLFLTGTELKPRNREVLKALAQQGAELYEVTAEVLPAASEVENSQGLVALAKRPQFTLEDLCKAKEPFLLLLAGVSDPGNLGSLLRSADAAGVDGVIVIQGSVSPFNSKCVRASMGSILRLPIVEKAEIAPVLEKFQQNQVRIIATDSHGGVEFRDANYAGAVALCLGAEAEGIPDLLRKSASLTVQIRLHHGVESLNVAAAGAILLFEIAGHRKSP